MLSSNARDRSSLYKNRGAFRPDELRRRREEQQVSIRREKRETNLAKRRNLHFNEQSDSEEEELTLQDEYTTVFPIFS
jgi:hypothetical protein